MKKYIFYVLIVLSMMSWGFSWPSTKVITYYISAYDLLFIRMFICSVTLIPVIYYLKLSLKFDLKSFILILIATALLILYNVFMFWGVQEGTAGIGGALVATLIPIMTFIFTSILSKKTISIKHSFALVLGAFGVLNIINIWHFNLQEIFSKHIIYFVLASMLWASLTIVSVKAAKVNSFIFTFYTYVFSSIIMYAFFIDGPTLFVEIFDYDFKFWFNIFVIAILSGTFGTSVYFVGAKNLGSKNASTFVFLVPSSAMISSYIFLDENITFTMIFGTVLTIISIYILNNINILKIFKK